MTSTPDIVPQRNIHKNDRSPVQFYLAPMEEITGYVYRNVYRDLFGDIDKYFTPFVTPTQKKVLKRKEQKEVAPANNRSMNVVPQILTNQSSQLIDTALYLYELGYREVNLNLGCPSATVVPKHKGAGFLSDLNKLNAFFDEVFSNPLFGNNVMELSVKTRLGLVSADEFPEILEIYNRYPLSEVIIHPQVRTDYYKNQVNLEAFSEALETCVHPICYNGDLFSLNDIMSFTSGFPSVSRIMLGRGIVANPGLIRELRTGKKISRKELFAYEKALYDGYTESYGDANNAVYKMKEVWFYLSRMFDDPEKVLKKICKTKHPAAYRAVVEELMVSGTVNKM